MALTSILVDKVVDNSTPILVDASLESLSDYERRKLAQQCTYPGCNEPPVDGHAQCGSHRKDELQRKRDYIARKREEWKREQRCSWCGRVRRKGSHWGCERHDPELVDKVVDNRTRVITEGDGRTRQRYVGQGRRGPMSRRAMNTADLDAALKETQRARDENEYAYSPEVEQLPRIQRLGERQKLRDRVYYAARFLLVVLSREGVDVTEMVKALKDSDT